jgi:hypothetical protein
MSSINTNQGSKREGLRPSRHFGIRNSGQAILGSIKKNGPRKGACLSFRLEA